jgi:transcriptional antiterminator
MSSEERTLLLRRLDAIERQLAELKAAKPKRPHLTRSAFAEAAGISERTVYRRLAANRIRTEQGRIPASQLDKFQS